MGDLLTLSEDILAEMKEIQKEDPQKAIACGARIDNTSDPLFYTCAVYAVPIDSLIGKMPSIEIFPARLPRINTRRIMPVHEVLNYNGFEVKGLIDREVLSDYLDIRDNYVRFMLQFARNDVKFWFENRNSTDPRHLFAHEMLFIRPVLTNESDPPSFITKKTYYLDKTRLEMELELSKKARQKMGVEIKNQ